ncbi:CHASE3 domain-containing protein [Ferruginibacter yonginensis]|uniref:histidine kinase n=1 Tax=Ferruginibacter yonginensis TaxID=1310416 RepID=A0ABV8QRW7_9BACT
MKLFSKDNLTPIKIIFLLAVVALASLSIFSYLKNKQLIENALLVNHTSFVKTEIEQNLSYLKDAETANRGFIITKDSSYLLPYFEAQQQIPVTLHILDSLVADNPKQKQQLQQLTSITNERMSVFKLRDSAQKSKEGVNALLLKGKIVMDEARLLSALMIHEEDRLLNQRITTLNNSVYFAPINMALLSIFAITLLIFSYLKIIAELKKSNQLQNDLRASNIILEKSNTELAQFAYVASHDLQEPLRKIQTFISRIQDVEPSMSDKAKDYFNRIVRSAKRMQQLILDILSYAQSSNETATTESVDLNNVLTVATSQLEILINEKQAIIKAAPLPSLNVVQYQIEQVFTNLLSNAIKFSKPQVKPIINITSSFIEQDVLPQFITNNNKAYHCISFIDNGIGFEPQYENRIFKIFHRLNDKETFEGNGIGLSIVKKIIDAHGGYIHATSSLGNGATFSIYLPHNV